MIFSVGTQLEQEKGGISTALIGFNDSKQLQQYGLEFITSHKENYRLTYAGKALFKVLQQVEHGDIVWFHVSSWLSMIRKLIIALAAKSKGGKVVFQFHGQEIYTLLKHKSATYLIYCLLKLADGLIVLTPWWQKYFKQKFPQFSHKLFVCPNPLDDSLSQAAKKPLKLKSTSGQIKLLAMSRLVPNKGFEPTLSAMTALPEHFTLSIAGEGILMESLKNQAKQLKITHRVEFLGWVDYQDKFSLLDEHHLFVLPSANDAFGMGFIEAMAHGLPVVALNYQATPDVVLNNQTGILVDDNSPQVMAKAIIHCSEHLTTMGKNAKDHVLNAFGNEQVSQALLDYFASL